MESSSRAAPSKPKVRRRPADSTDGGAGFRLKYKPDMEDIPDQPHHKRLLVKGKVYNVGGVVKMWDSRQWRKLCTSENCGRLAVTKGRCKAHGGGLRCSHTEQAPDGSVVACPHSAVDKRLLCKAHGGGRRCKHRNDTGVHCQKSAAGVTDFCKQHGGGLRCDVSGCQNSAVSPTAQCIRHGGGMRCSFVSRKPGSTGQAKVTKAGSGVSSAAAGASATAAAGAVVSERDLVCCRNSSLRGSGFCVRHGALGQCAARLCLNDKVDMDDSSSKFCATHKAMDQRYGALGVSLVKKSNKRPRASGSRNKQPKRKSRRPPASIASTTTSGSHEDVVDSRAKIARVGVAEDASSSHKPTVVAGEVVRGAAQREWRPSSVPPPPPPPMRPPPSASVSPFPVASMSPSLAASAMQHGVPWQFVGQHLHPYGVVHPSLYPYQVAFGLAPDWQSMLLYPRPPLSAAAAAAAAAAMAGGLHRYQVPGGASMAQEAAFRASLLRQQVSLPLPLRHMHIPRALSTSPPVSPSSSVEQSD